LLVGYVIYALVMALVVTATYGSLVRLRLIAHVFDLAVFSVFIYLTEGPTSPFFLYFVFSILCGALRWQLRGTLWTAVFALAAFVAMGFFAEAFLHDPAFELNRFIMRGSYLGVVAVLFGYLGLHESQRRNQLSQLAEWPRAPLLDLEKLLAQIMAEAQSILKTQRVLMVWEESQEPWLHLALFAGGKLARSRKPTGSFASLVAEPLEGKSFFSQDLRQSSAVAVDGVSHEAQLWRGAPVKFMSFPLCRAVVLHYCPSLLSIAAP
jgi:hypothetical protein